MPCDLSKGAGTLACKDTVSGLKSIYMVNYSGASIVTGSSSTSAGQFITGLSLPANSSFKYELKNSANTFEQDGTSSRDNGTTMFTQTLNFSLTKLTAEKEFQIKMMALGRPQIFVELNSGEIFLMGKDLGCEISTKSMVGGTLDSFNGYQMTAVGTEKDTIYYLSGTALTTLTSSVSSSNVTV